MLRNNTSGLKQMCGWMTVRALPVRSLKSSCAACVPDWWWWCRLSCSSRCDTLLSSFSTTWAKPRWSCLKLDQKRTLTKLNALYICIFLNEFACVQSVVEYLCRSRLRSSLVRWVRSSLPLLSLCTSVFKASKRRASRWKLGPRWPVTESTIRPCMYCIICSSE